jgi:hypothetical protein
MPIKDSHAYVIFSLVDIPKDQIISVSYTQDGYHDPLQDCLCSTCKPEDPPASPERRPQLTSIPLPNPGKKKRRGGKRARSRRGNQKERVDAQNDEQEELAMSENDESG